VDEDGAPAVEIMHALSGRARWDDVRHTQRYALHSDGTLRITSQVRVAPDVVDLPRIGLELVLPPELERISWYGRGPGDAYSDRKASSLIDVHSSTVTDQYVPYIMPQEHGHKTDVRWLRLTAADGRGLEITGDALFEFNALHFTDADLAAAQHTPELTPRPEVTLHLDHAMRGLGTGLGMDTLPQYQLDAADYRFTFYLKRIYSARRLRDRLAASSVWSAALEALQRRRAATPSDRAPPETPARAPMTAVRCGRPAAGC
jgi:beta-galactosidase